MIPRVNFGDKDGSFELDGADSRAILEIPEDALAILRRAQEETVIGRPATALLCQCLLQLIAEDRLVEVVPE